MLNPPVNGTPVAGSFHPVRCGGVYEWCGLEGIVPAMKHVGARTDNGQLEPAICESSNGLPTTRSSDVRPLLRTGINGGPGASASRTAGCNVTIDVGAGGRTFNGWTRPIFKQFLEYLDTEKVRALAVWSQPSVTDARATGGQPATLNSSCTKWMLEEIRAWRHRD